MADKTIPDLTVLTSIDRAADLFEVSDTSDLGNSKGTTVNSMLNITSQPMGLTDTQSPTNKTLDNTNTITLKDTLFTLQDDGDTTKQAKFQLSGITTGTTRTYTLPNASSTLVDLSTSQTLTNKTLTSPTISAPTITNPTLTVDTISEFTAANGVTIDGLNIKDSKVGTNGVNTASIEALAVTEAKMATAVTWWAELGRTTLSVAGSTITVSGFTPKKYLRIFFTAQGSGGTVTNAAIRLNNDSAGNYALRASTDGGADGTATASTSLINPSGPTTTGHLYLELEITNSTSLEKIAVIHSVNAAAGAATAPSRTEYISKWANTASRISRIDAIASVNNFAIGSEIVVLGHD